MRPVNCSPLALAPKAAHVNPLEPRSLSYSSLLPRPRTLLVEVSRFEYFRVRAAFYTWMYK